MDAKITKTRLSRLLSYDWLKIVGVIAGVQKAKGSGNICTCCGKQAVALGAHAGNLAREIAKMAGGNGGGKPDMAMAGAKEPEKVESALSTVKDTVFSMLK